MKAHKHRFGVGVEAKGDVKMAEASTAAMIGKEGGTVGEGPDAAAPAGSAADVTDSRDVDGTHLGTHTAVCILIVKPYSTCFSLRPLVTGTHFSAPCPLRLKFAMVNLHLASDQ